MRGDILILFIAVLFVSGCTQKTFEDRETLLSFLKDPENGYLQQKQVNGLDVAVMYRPTDLLVAQELRGDANQQIIDSLRKKYNDYLYFNLSLSQNGKELLSTLPTNRNEFGALVNQLAFGMDQKIHLYTQSKDTIEMADYVYPRMYGMSGSTSILLVYPNNEEIANSEKLTLALEDIGWGTGEIKCKFDTNKIKEQPEIGFK